MARDRETLRSTEARWSLWLGIGNAGGAVFVISHILTNITKSISYLLLPSAWMFAGGLLSIGASVLVAMIHGKILVKTWDDFDFDGAENSRPPPKLTDSLGIACWALEIFSAALFLLGVLYPLAVVSARYVCSGQLEP